MSRGTLMQLATTVSGALSGDNASYDGVSIDSRSLSAGELFVALQGPRFDGHEFVEAAAARGAAGALVQRAVVADLPQVIARDSRSALGVMASAWRGRFRIPLIGVTGSNGKTSVKEMLRSILSRRFSVLATHGNLNNDIGVPLTLLRLDEGHQAAVIEMGANHVGEIALLASLARPTVGLVTNAGPAHLEGFGSQDNVALGKGELFESLDAGCTAVINMDDVYAPQWKARAGSARVVGFGRAGDVHWSDVQQNGAAASPHLRFTLHTPEGSCPVVLPLGGLHNVANAAAAAAAAQAVGVSLDDIVAGLACLRAVPGRLHVHETAAGVRVIDDSYNANPASLDSAMQFAVQATGPAWIALGDMGELGRTESALHAEVGRRARELGLARLYAVGPLSRAAADAFGEQGYWFETSAALAAALRSDVTKGVTVLVKGSRSAHLETVVAALLGGTGDNAAGEAEPPAVRSH